MINSLNSETLQRRIKKVIAKTAESIAGEKNYNKIFNSKVGSCNYWYNNNLSRKVLFYSLNSI